MYPDVVEIRNFYASAPGRLAAESVGNSLSAMGGCKRGDRVMGYGFATPFLETYRENAERIIAFMPGPQGVIDWPPDQPSATALVEYDSLPLPDSCLDLVLIVHALETTPHPDILIAEIRRVLCQGGHLMIAAANRQGYWARSDQSPFGFGRPYSRRQLRLLLNGLGFEILEWSSALHVPIWQRKSLWSWSSKLDRIGQRFWPAIAGVTCVRAVKESLANVEAAPDLLERLSPAYQPQTVQIRSGTSQTQLDHRSD